MSADERPADGIRERCGGLAHAGERLADRPVREVVAALAAAAARWRDSRDPDRREGQRALADHFRVPESAIAPILDLGFGAWTVESLLNRIRVELGDERALDSFVGLGSARRMAFGPRLAVAIASHGVPTTPVGDLIDLLSVKATVWLKPAAGADDLALRFARTVREVDAEIGAAIEVSGWTPGSPAASAVLEAADLVVATGRQETSIELRRTLGADVRLVLHGPRISAAILTREALVSDAQACVDALADDVAFAGQMGCLSPVVAWVEDPEGERLVPDVHRACVERWPAPGRTHADAAERAAWSEWSSLTRVERASGLAGRVAGEADSGWSIQWRHRAEPPLPPPAPRILFLAPIGDVREAVGLCAEARGVVATVGVAGGGSRIDSLAPALAGAGVERVAVLGRMQQPPADWRRDGRPSLADLVRWVDREG